MLEKNNGNILSSVRKENRNFVKVDFMIKFI